MSASPLPAFVLLSLGLTALATPLPELSEDAILWQPCPELNANITRLNMVQGSTFDCGSLNVPLDYTDLHGERLDLALFKINATEPPSLGSVLINFGGPGATAPDNLALFAKQLAANIGPRWDLVSWDPRGTGKTLPFDCGPNAQLTPGQTIHKRDYAGLSSMNLTETFVNGGWEWAGHVADECLRTMNTTGHLIGTAFTARDMMQIVDALNGDGLLRYYGWSYGTMVGSYAAALFPDRIERMVLDANMNPYTYQTGHNGDALRDADKALYGFLRECLANKPNCTLAQSTNATEAKHILDAINANLLLRTGNQTLESYETFIRPIYLMLYTPSSWPILSVFIDNLLDEQPSDPVDESASPANEIVEPYNLGAQWAVFGILGSDALWRTDELDEYLPQVKYQGSVSSFGHQYLNFWPSVRWRMDAKERYSGNFTVRTKHPILYVNGEYDPSTPLLNAYAASKGFEDSVVLAHNGYGHGIIASPSRCVAEHMQRYFKDGVLPQVGSRCEPDQSPWKMDIMLPLR